MDTAFGLHILGKLDTLREEQIRISSRIEEALILLRALKVLTPTKTEVLHGEADSLPLKKWLGLLRPLCTAAVSAGAGVLAVAYALKGGDLVSAITTLLKLL